MGAVSYCCTDEAGQFWWDCSLLSALLELFDLALSDLLIDWWALRLPCYECFFSLFAGLSLSFSVNLASEAKPGRYYFLGLCLDKRLIYVIQRS